MYVRMYVCTYTQSHANTLTYNAYLADSFVCSAIKSISKKQLECKRVRKKAKNIIEASN